MAGIGGPAHLVLSTLEALQVDRWFEAGVKVPELGLHRLGLESKLCPPLRYRFVISCLSPPSFWVPPLKMGENIMPNSCVVVNLD